jgi:sugar lactone lactonase YvrE
MNKPEDMFVIFSLPNNVPGGEELEHEDIVSSLRHSGYRAATCEHQERNTRHFMELEGRLKVSLNTVF